MNWVTWENVGIDRMACAWLIRRFIDPQAAFAFIPEGSTGAPAGAHAFDIPGAKFSHHGGHCSFHAVLAAHPLNDPALRTIARIIDDADAVQEVTLEAAAAELDMVCKGIRRISHNDQAALDRAMDMFDGVYAQIQADNHATP